MARKDPRQRTIDCMVRARDCDRRGTRAAYRQRGADFTIPSRTTAGRSYTVRVFAVGPHPVCRCDCTAGGHWSSPAGALACWHAASVLFDLAVRDLAWFDGDRWRLTSQAIRLVSNWTATTAGAAQAS